jgi:hypothetical protein
VCMSEAMTPTPKPEHGLGLGVAITSVIILATVVYLKLTRADVTEKPAATTQSTLPARSGREGDARILRRRRRRARLGLQAAAHVPHQ